MSDKYLNPAGVQELKTYIDTKDATKQDTLVSGTNIKTIGGASVLGSGDINLPTPEVFCATYGVTTFAELKEAIDANKIIVVYGRSSSSGGDVIAQAGYDTTVGLDTVVQQNRIAYMINSADVWTYTRWPLATMTYVDDLVYGLENPTESISINSDGQLDVGGRLGQMSNSTGVYSPKSINPAAVGNGSFLLTEGSGQRLGNKSLAVVTGSGLSLKTAAAAGATTYLVSNTYENRIICAGIVGGVLCLNEATAADNYVNVTSVTIGGYDPSKANYWTASGDITIKTDDSINPNSSVSSVRPYCFSGSGFSNLLVGQQSGGIGGASIVVGQKVYSASGNACAVVGASIYNTGNGNALFGRQHISRKNRWLMAGTGHNNTSGRSESGVAVGQWSQIDSDEILFVVGDGTSDTARSNAFEVRDQAIVIKSPNGTRWKITVSNTGTLTTTAL